MKYLIIKYSSAIRIAISGLRWAASAGALSILWSRTLAMIACGAAFGAGLALIAARYVELLYEVKPSHNVLVRGLLAMLVITAITSIAPVAPALTIEAWP